MQWGTVADKDKFGASGGKYTSEYASMEKLSVKTKETNVKAVSEGVIMLKNGNKDGTGEKLPYSGYEKRQLVRHKLRPVLLRRLRFGGQ